MFTIRPCPCRCIAGWTARMPSHTPRVFTASTRSHSSTVISVNGRLAPSPA